MDTRIMDTRIMNNADKKYGCSICFARIEKNEKVLLCHAPCNKLFHPDCFHKSIKDINLWDIKCCYCQCNIVTQENLFDHHNNLVHTICEMRHIYLNYKHIHIHDPENPILLLLDGPKPKKEHIKQPKQSKRSFYKSFKSF